MNPVIVAIDFDNTIFNSPDDYDDIPKQLIPKAKETIKWLSQHGWTGGQNIKRWIATGSTVRMGG